MSRPNSFLTYSLLLLSFTNLSSCGGGNSSSKTVFSVNAIISEEHPISDGERGIATRICYAYQSKSKNFRSSTYFGGQFVFTSNKTECNNTKNSYQIYSNVKYDNSNNLIYGPSAGTDTALKFVNLVQTDTNGYLAQLCDKIKNNLSISNTTTQGSVKVQISFIREDLDGFFLQYFVKQADNVTYKIDSAEKFKVRTQFDFTNGQVLGMDEYYSSQKVCSSSFDVNKNSDFTQTFTSR